MKRREFLRVVAQSSGLAGLGMGCATTRKGHGMNVEHLAMPPFNTTLMGVLKGTLDYYGFDVSDATIFGASGHAFLINIHEQLCPSGPYCWKRTGYERLVKNLGVEVTDLGFFSPESDADARSAIEKRLREALDSGLPCALLNLENQLITGYDVDGFITAQPWPAVPDFPPAKLTFGTWQELGDKVHVNFFIYEKIAPAERKVAILESLDYAVDLHRNPSHYSLPKYGIGADAYDNWIGAVEGYGASHGNWWNGIVWSECRQMASQYFGEIGQEFAQVSDAAGHLSALYADLADILGQISDKEMDVKRKIALLREAKSKEAMAVEKAALLAESLRAGA